MLIIGKNSFYDGTCTFKIEPNANLRSTKLNLTITYSIAGSKIGCFFEVERSQAVHVSTVVQALQWNKQRSSMSSRNR